MKKISLALVSASLLFVSACSSSGRSGTGSPDEYGDVEEGNIPGASGSGSELADISFDYDSSALSGSAESTLKKNASWLTSHSSQKVVVEGHCDERGTSEYNLALGERRAKSVADYLRTMGASSSQLSTISYGEELPLDPAKNEAAYAKNRRAHFSMKK